MVSDEIKMFESLVMKDIEKISTKIDKHNLTKEERMALKNLQKDPNIIIKPADKGGGIVIWAKEAYKEEALHILNDNSTYTKLKKDPVSDIRLKLIPFLQEGLDKNILNKSEFDYLSIEFTKIPHFYILPKVHKNLLKPPGRPIVAGIDSISSRLSEYVDVLLQPLVRNISSYLKDTISMLQVLKELVWQKGDLLVTCDVNALYSSIPHELGLIKLEEEILKTNMIGLDHMQFILESVRFILNNNYFKFEEDFYIQRKGTAMGTKFAPSYANLYMAAWETGLVYGSHSWAQGRVHAYRRYIDDVFFVWRGGEDQLRSFLASLDSPEWGIKLDNCWSLKEVNFLDLNIYIEDDCVKSKTFFKEVDNNTFIDCTSCHHAPWLKGVPKGQFVRLRRNCSDGDTYKEQALSLKQDFLDKGYDDMELVNIILELSQTDRDNYLEYKPNNKEVKEPLFICDYNHKADKIKKILKKHWPILKNDVDLADVIGPVPKIVFRGAENIKSNMVRSKPRKKGSTTNNHFGLKEGFYQCGMCLACRSTSNKKNFISSYYNHKQDKLIKIKGILNCCSKNVVYMLECPCGLGYIGRTKRALNVRISEHARNIRNGYDKHSVSLHCKIHHNSSPVGVKFWALEQVKKIEIEENLPNKLGKAEMRHIFEHGTMVPKGLNDDFEVIHFL
uniref:Helix-turn-helix domain-containing protein n=1 Tax=Leptobrachium leishanense TaxID=445787 RepID=A0A8C5PKA4_9ANUR